MQQQNFMEELFKSLRLNRYFLMADFLNTIEEVSKNSLLEIVDKFPEDLSSEEIVLPIYELAFSKGNKHLWAEAYCLTQYKHIARTLKTDNPFIGTVSIKEKCDEDKDFIIRLLAHLFMKDLEEIESKNTDLTIYDIEYENEMYTIKFVFLQKDTLEEIYFLDDTNQAVDIKIMVCLTSED